MFIIPCYLLSIVSIGFIMRRCFSGIFNTIITTFYETLAFWKLDILKLLLFWFRIRLKGIISWQNIKATRQQFKDFRCFGRVRLSAIPKRLDYHRDADFRSFKSWLQSNVMLTRFTEHDAHLKENLQAEFFSFELITQRMQISFVTGSSRFWEKCWMFTYAVTSEGINSLI